MVPLHHDNITNVNRVTYARGYKHKKRMSDDSAGVYDLEMITPFLALRQLYNKYNSNKN